MNFPLDFVTEKLGGHYQLIFSMSRSVDIYRPGEFEPTKSVYPVANYDEDSGILTICGDNEKIRTLLGMADEAEKLTTVG